MITFLKSQAAALVGTAVDFLITVLAVELVGLWYVAGTVLGTISGGIANFALGRTWVFNASTRTIAPQIFKYFMVWNGSLALNAGGVFLLTHYTGSSYLFSKLLTSLLVGFFYNYLIQKKYVFQ
jgi:putative flippase GtrA